MKKVSEFTGEDWLATIIALTAMSVSIYIPYNKYEKNRESVAMPLVYDIKNYNKGSITEIRKFDEEIWKNKKIKKYEDIIENEFGENKIDEILKLRKEVVDLKKELEKEGYIDGIKKAEKIIKNSKEKIKEIEEEIENVEEKKEEFRKEDFETISLIGREEGISYIESKFERMNETVLLAVKNENYEEVDVPSYGKEEVVVEYTGQKIVNKISGKSEKISVYSYISNERIRKIEESIRDAYNTISTQRSIIDKAKRTINEIKKSANEEYGKEVEKIIENIRGG